jgi:glutamine amidotransferase
VLTVVDLGVGNIGSLVSALRFLGAQHRVTSEPEDVRKASTLILPGVGSFPAAAERLDDLLLRESILEHVGADRALLGVCLGMQLLLETSEEGNGRGLGLIAGGCERIGNQSGVKVPHVGFDTVNYPKGSWLQGALGPSADYYFTHSFAMRSSVTVTDGSCDYDGGFVAVVERWPIVGAQFHPEKSQTSGLGFLRAFLERARG